MTDFRRTYVGLCTDVVLFCLQIIKTKSSSALETATDMHLFHFHPRSSTPGLYLLRKVGKKDEETRRDAFVGCRFKNAGVVSTVLYFASPSLLPSGTCRFETQYVS